MKFSHLTAVGLLAGSSVAWTAHGQWVQFENETSQRWITDDPEVGADDTDEKAYAWGDLNKNGRIDLVVVRKEIGTSSGRRRNALFMNEGIEHGWDVDGVLVDRTAEYATDSDVPGDDGFLTPTNDRDVVLADVNGNGWLDIITATTLSDGHPKHISYPRVYINKGEVNGEWLGFRYEDGRIPQFEGNAGDGTPHAPRFCAVAAGDVTGNGAPDLYFSDYDSGGFQTLDFDDRLLINDGNGYFTDESHRIPSTWLESNFGNSAVIADLNDNGHKDIIKNTSLGPYETRVMYNDPLNPGHFNQSQIIADSSPYFVNVSDLNNNGRLDVVIVDDGNDRYRLNQGTNPDGTVDWSPTNFNSQSGFRSDIVIADLNNSGWKDILIADVDADITNCTATANIYRNNGDAPNVTFTHDTGNISNNDIRGTFDFAVFDLTGNGWNDIIAGRCGGDGGVAVLINQPSFGIDFEFPEGRPEFVTVDDPGELVVKFDPFGQSLDTASPTLHVSEDGRNFEAIPMSPTGGTNTFSAEFPSMECGAIASYYVSASLEEGLELTSPAGAPTSHYNVAVAEGTEVAYHDDIEGDVSDWTVENDSSLTGGAWEQAVPNGTICCGGQLSSPDGDASPDPDGQAFTTENCEPGAHPSNCNVQGGTTELISPSLELGSANAVISYDRWFFSSDDRELATYVSTDNGRSWVLVHTSDDTGGEWENVSFLVSDFIEPADSIRVKFSVTDDGETSITNAGIDNLLVDALVCEADTIPGDLTGDGTVSGADLGVLLSEWGPCSDCEDCLADLTGDCEVGGADLGVLLSNWTN